MITLSARFGLTLWGADTDVIQRQQWLSDNQAIESLAAIAQSGPTANRPAAGQFGRFWFDPNVDGGFLSLDNGIVWEPVLCRVDTTMLAADRPNPGQEGLYIYERDQDRLFRDNGSKWVEVITSTLIPAGIVLPTMSATQPTGWLFCDGSSYSTASYPDLFAAIGYRFGGSGSSFKVPSLQNRMLMGGPNTGSIGGLGSTASTSVPNHQHVVDASIPSHVHTAFLEDHTHSYSAPTPAAFLEVQDVTGIIGYDPSGNLTASGGGYSLAADTSAAGAYTGTPQLNFTYCNFIIKTSN